MWTIFDRRPAHMKQPDQPSLIMTPEESQICLALENHLGSYLSKDNEAVIAQKYGEAVLRRVKAIYTQAIDSPVDWRTAKMDDALAILGGVLDKLPWLTQKARGNLVHAFIMTWK